MAREDAPFLTRKDVREFLTYCEEEDEVGTPASVHSCLAVEAIRWKYRKEQGYALLSVSVDGNNRAFDYTYYKDPLNKREGFIDADVTPFLDTFDDIYDVQAEENREYEPISKEELLSLAPVFVELLAEEVPA